MSVPERPSGGAEALVVPSVPASVALVRRYAVAACVGLGRSELADTVALLVSEVATSAVLHAYGPDLRVRVLVQDRLLRVEVFDGSPALPVQRCAAAGAAGVRGLALVEALALAWGADARADGRTTWFEVG